MMRNRFAATIAAIGALLLTAFPGTHAAEAQALTVLPVTITMMPDQMAAALTVIDDGSLATSFQLRPFAWTQPGGGDSLKPTEWLLVSPPLGTIQAGARQVIRVVLRRPPVGSEASYRLLLDQIPPPASPGTVRIALRLSIPIFAEPATRAAPDLAWRVERIGGRLALVAVNSGNRHETVRNLRLSTQSGAAIPIATGTSPYVLAGATQIWPIASPHPPLAAGETLRLSAGGDSGPIDLPVSVVGGQ
jgi:fimbrial chaperone protein